MTIAESGDLLLVTDVSFGSAIVDFDTPVFIQWRLATGSA
jgi:hypothetical protein